MLNTLPHPSLLLKPSKRLGWEERCYTCPTRHNCNWRLPLRCPDGTRELILPFEIPGEAYISRHLVSGKFDREARTGSRRKKPRKRRDYHSKGKVCLGCLVFDGKRQSVCNSSKRWLCLRHFNMFKRWRRHRQVRLAA